MRPRRIGVLVSTAVLVLALDIVSKVAVVANLSDHPPVRLLGGFLTLLVSRNPGAAFSIGTSMTLVFSAIAVGVIVLILRTSWRIRSIPWALTLGLLLGGATGNLLDRLFRYPGPFRGYVVDWIMVPHWPVFNLADSAIVCGGVLAVLLSARGTRLDGLRVSTGPVVPEQAPGTGGGPAAVLPQEHSSNGTPGAGPADQAGRLPAPDPAVPGAAAGPGSRGRDAADPAARGGPAGGR
ncbi:MAG TPA: signal peptidase II [Streptosporangiaceae bacterium]|nr:signal peptidase II [Streptosporangiaceae bacterium]